MTQQVTMNEIIYDYHSSNFERKKKTNEPKEESMRIVSQEKLKIEKGMFFRDKQGNVYRIKEMGKTGVVQGKRVSKKDRSGNDISYTQSRNYKTFYVYDRNAYCAEFCYDEFDVIEIHEKIIDCLYPDDIILCKEDCKFYRVIKRRKNKQYDFLECKGKDGVKCIINEDIIKKLNTNIPYRAMATINKGDRIRHVIFGWAEVKEVYSNRIKVSNGRNTFTILRKDIKDVRQ